MSSIILFDGVCNFCSGSVQFIIKRDPEGQFRFASQQGKVGSHLLKKYGIGEDLDSLVLIENETYYVKSDAALRICRNLKGFWKVFVILQIIPTPIRNFFYDIVARNRYQWFGKKESCMLPTPDIKDRFLEGMD